MLARHKCKAVSVPLGAYGALSESFVLSVMISGQAWGDHVELLVQEHLDIILF